MPPWKNCKMSLPTRLADPSITADGLVSAPSTEVQSTRYDSIVSPGSSSGPKEKVATSFSRGSLVGQMVKLMLTSQGRICAAVAHHVASFDAPTRNLLSPRIDEIAGVGYERTINPSPGDGRSPMDGGSPGGHVYLLRNGYRPPWRMREKWRRQSRFAILVACPAPSTATKALAVSKVTDPTSWRETPSLSPSPLGKVLP